MKLDNLTACKECGCVIYIPFGNKKEPYIICPVCNNDKVKW